MFGLFKKKTVDTGPVDFEFDIEIEKSAEEVYALIDWEDERNAHAVLGNAIEPLSGETGHFIMTMPMLPEMKFWFRVVEAKAPNIYAFDGVIEPQCGNLAHNHERYTFEATGENSCKVTLFTQVTFVDGLREREFVSEVAMMATSVQSSLNKLKLQAEHGVEVAKALEEHTIV